MTSPAATSLTKSCGKHWKNIFCSVQKVRNIIKGLIYLLKYTCIYIWMCMIALLALVYIAFIKASANILLKYYNPESSLPLKYSISGSSVFISGLLPPSSGCSRKLNLKTDRYLWDYKTDIIQIWMFINTNKRPTDLLNNHHNINNFNW